MDFVDISITEVPKELRNCLNCGMLGCCPTMLSKRLTNLKDRKETPGSCSKWRDQHVMNPQRDPMDTSASTCIDCNGIACKANGKYSTKVTCQKIQYDGKPLSTVEYAPACLLFDGQKLIRDEKEANQDADGGMEAEVAADTIIDQAIPEATDAVQISDSGEASISPLQNEESAAVSSPERLQVLAAEIRFLTKLTVENAIGIGARLLEAKDMVAHGEWGKWLEHNVHYSQDTAGRFMSIAGEYANSAAPRNLSLGALYELLSLPKPERDEFIGEIHVIDGREKRVEDMSTRELRAAIARRKRHEEELEARLDTQRKALDQAYVDKSNALNALRDRLNTEFDAKIQEVVNTHAAVIADLREDIALKNEEISGMERPRTITVEVEKVVAPPDYGVAIADAEELRHELNTAQERLALIPQVLKRPAPMKLLDARNLGNAVDSFLGEVSSFPFCGPVLFAGDRPMKKASFKLQLDKLGIWLAASYAALEGRVLEVPENAEMDG